MKIWNVVCIFFLSFIDPQTFTFIADLVGSTSVYDEILPLSVPNPISYVVFDVFDKSDDYYPLGLTVKSGPNKKKEFFVDDLITFGKEIKFVFGNKCVSLTSFARNVKLTLTWNVLWYLVDIEFDLHGSKITRRYEESQITLPGQLRRFRAIDNLEGLIIPGIATQPLEEETLGDEDTEEVSELILPSQPTKTDQQPVVPEEVRDSVVVVEEETKDKETEETTVTKPTTETETTPDPAFQYGRNGQIEITKDSLTGATGYKDSETLSAGSLDFRCVLFENTGDVYKNLCFKGSKFKLPRLANTFEICYCQHSNDHYLVVSSQFESITVEQSYKHNGFGLYPHTDFRVFENLNSYPERKLGTGAPPPSVTDYVLKLDNYDSNSNSFLEKVDCGKCTVYRYTDGLEDQSRMGAVTSVDFGDVLFKIPPERKFVMVSVCKPYLSTTYVTIMMKDLFLYESKVYHTIDGKSYRERKFMEDEERLDIINMTSRVWHNRNHASSFGQVEEGVNNDVEVLCLNQFTRGKRTSFRSCKDIKDLKNFQLLYNGQEFTNLVFKKGAKKSSVVLGNVIFDMNTDNDSDTYVYISHPLKEPATVLVLNNKIDNYSIIETGHSTNIFVPVRDTFHEIPSRSSRKEINLSSYRGSHHGITWDYNEYLKEHFLYPSRFPEYCIGDLTFHNLKFLSHKGEGYKHISTTDRDKLTKVKVTIVINKKKTVLEVEVVSGNTLVEMLEAPTTPSFDLNML